MTSFTSLDIKNLAGLLNLEEEFESDDEYDLNPVGSNCNPHRIAQEIKTSQRKEITESNDFNKYVAHDTKNIWSDDEVLDEDDDEAKIKSKPDYEMLFQQTVTPDDVFLQLSDKGPGSDSCECLLVKIKLPGINSKEEVSLNLSALKLICKTKKHYLNLDLPREIDPVKCSARWDQTQSLLTVTLSFDIEHKLKF